MTGDNMKKVRWGIVGPGNIANKFAKAIKNVETAEVFAKSEVKAWECRNCGHIVVGKEAPELCPTCAHPQSYFEIHNENY